MKPVTSICPSYKGQAIARGITDPNWVIYSNGDPVPSKSIFSNIETVLENPQVISDGVYADLDLTEAFLGIQSGKYFGIEIKIKDESAMTQTTDECSVQYLSNSYSAVAIK